MYYKLCIQLNLVLMNPPITEDEKFTLEKL